MKISVVVCTYNRWRQLSDVLGSLMTSRVPAEVVWEVLVVDNNSKDQTRQVVEQWAQRHPGRIRYTVETQQGLSCARNAGIRQSDAEVLAFTDDDATVEPDWLWSLVSNLERGEWIGSGGRIVPVWPGPIPRWLSVTDPATMGPFAAFDLGPEPGPLMRPPYGGNMAYRREAFTKYGEFRVDLGRTGSNLLAREDLEFANRLLAAGERLRWEPQAIVHHPVEKSRMTRAYVSRWWYWYGRSEVVESGAPPASWAVVGVPLFLFRRFVRWCFQSLITWNAPARFSCQRNAAYVAGMIAACFQMAQTKSSTATATPRVSGSSSKHPSTEPL